MAAALSNLSFELLLGLANRVAERLSRLDPDTAAALGALEGRTLALHLREPQIALRLSIADGLIRVAARGEEPVDVTLEGKARSMGSLIHSRDALYGGEVRASGDLGVAQQLGDILGNVHIDWEEELAAVSGDALAHRLGVAGRDFHRWTARTIDALRDASRDYLQDELRLLVSPTQLETLLKQIDVLRLDVDRLEARIRLLEDTRRTLPE